MDKNHESPYSRRLKRIDDAIRLKKPDKVPIIFEFGYFVARYGGITYEETFYDHSKLAEAYRKTVTDLEPDAFNCLPFDSGPAMEAINVTTMKWPGHGISPGSSHQYVEGEYMMADEYDAFMQNPTDFILRTYLPRTCGALGALKDLPGLFNFMGISRGRMSPFFATADSASAFQAIYRASLASGEWDNSWRSFVNDIEAKGYPAITHTSSPAPFDFFSDHLRGMKGIMLDMYRQPDKLLAAMDAVLPFLVQKIKTTARVSRNNLVFMGPHRGAEGFMSLKQFEKFYWPGFKTIVLTLIESGFTPYILWEGDYTSRLKYLLELPPGKIIHRFDRTDVFKAREVLGGDHCICGGMPPSLLHTGSVQQVKDRCKKLIEIVGRDGAYIMGHSTPVDEARIENVRAMIDTTREYGVY